MKFNWTMNNLGKNYGDIYKWKQNNHDEFLMRVS